MAEVMCDFYDCISNIFSGFCSNKQPNITIVSNEPCETKFRCRTFKKIETPEQQIKKIKELVRDILKTRGYVGSDHNCIVSENTCIDRLITYCDKL